MHSPDDREIRSRFGEAINSGQYGLASQLIEDIIRKGDRSSQNYTLWAYCLFRDALFWSREGDLQQANHQAYYGRRVIDKALELATQERADNETRGEIYYIKGQIHSIIQEYNEAEKSFREAQHLGREVEADVWEALRREKMRKVAGWGALAAMVIGGTIGKMAKDSWDEFGLH